MVSLTRANSNRCWKTDIFQCRVIKCFVDNVHFQQAAEISEALVEEQVDFEAMVRRL